MRPAIGVWVVGTGWGQQHLRYLGQTAPGLKLFLCGRSEARAAGLVRRLGASGYFTSLEAAASDPRVQGLTVALSHDLHRHAVEVVCANGRHVLVEKPIATTQADAEAIIEAVEGSGVVLMVAEDMHFRPGVREAVGLIERGAIGEPLYPLGHMGGVMQPWEGKAEAGAAGNPGGYPAGAWDRPGGVRGHVCRVLASIRGPMRPRGQGRPLPGALLATLERMSRHPGLAAPSHPAPALPPLREEGGPVVTLAFVGLAVYLWVIHSYKLSIGTWGIVVGLFGLVLSQYRIRVPTPLLWFGGFILWGTITAPLAVNTAATIQAVQEYTKLWLIALVAANVAHTRRQLYILIVTWLGVFALYPVRGTFFNFLSGISHSGRTAWNFTFSNPNDLAALTLPMLALAIMMLQSDRAAKWVRVSALAGVILLPLLIVVTQSRGGILALGTMGLLILAEYRRQARGIAVAALAGGVLILVAPPESWQRVSGLSAVRAEQGLRGVDQEGSADQRFEIWRVAMAIAKDHPVAGVGLGNYAESHYQYALSTEFRPTARGRRDTHSIYLNALAETGFIGAGLLLAMFVSALLLAVRRARMTALENPAAARQLKTLAIGLIAVMQAGTFGTLHGVAFIHIYIGILGAAGMILGAESQPAHLAGRRGVSEGLRRPRGRSDRLAPETVLPDLAFHHAGQPTGRSTG